MDTNPNEDMNKNFGSLKKIMDRSRRLEILRTGMVIDNVYYDDAQLRVGGQALWYQGGKNNFGRAIIEKTVGFEESGQPIVSRYSYPIDVAVRLMLKPHTGEINNILAQNALDNPDLCREAFSFESEEED